ncbi:MAG: hypothetical protein M0R46_14675 [Candidatus Muirbacterium halophilum]|nr:hypothetical protein [Candidatus Muirbacterium halophilum]
MKKFLLVFIMILSFITFIWSDTNSDRRDFLESVWTDKNQAVSIEQVWETLSQQEKVMLSAALKQMILSQIPKDVFENPDNYLSAVKDEEFKQYIKIMSKVVLNSDPAKIAKLLETIDKDHILIADPAIFKAVHEYLGSGFTRVGNVENTPAFIKDDFSTVGSLSFLDENDSIFSDELPKSKWNKVSGNFSQELGKMSNLINIPDATIINSIRLADVLNQISNHDSNGVYSEVVFKTDSANYTLKRPVDLINVLKVSDEYETVAFEVRMGVDYGGYSIKKGSEFLSLEIPSFVTTQINNKKVLFPSNHSEFVLAVYKKGKKVPTALVKWYMGIPSDNKLHQGTIWKPAIWTHSNWTGTKIVSIHDELIDQRNLVHSAMYTMKLYNSIQKENKFPMNGYGMLAVCNDSVSIMRTILGDSPMTSGFPNLRSLKYDSLYADTLEKFGGKLRLSMGILNVPTDVYPEKYREAANISRLALSFPYRNEKNIIGYSHRETYEMLMEIDSSFASKIK